MMAGDKKSSTSSAHAEHVRLELETVLRIRPLLKKEKGDQVVLEPRRMEDGRPATAVLHPMLAKQKQNPESPAMKMLSPETLHLCKDTEYHLNHILPEDTDQEKVYYSLGLPIARASMDFLKFGKNAKAVKRTTNLVICTGVDQSGRTHTCFGGNQGNIPKRRSPDDGLVPRILDSLFSQSKHHVKNRRNLSFAVKMSLIQVTQTRTDQPKHEDDSNVQDLLLPSLSKAATSPLRSPSPSRLPSVKSLVATLEKARSTTSSSSARNTEAKVTLSQDPATKDFTTNAIVKTCRDVTEARRLLSTGLQAGQKFTTRNTKGHVLALLQPVLLGNDGATEREGGKIGVLDMAGIEQSAQKKRNTAVRRHKDSVGTSGQSDPGLNAVLHCVRSLQHNSMILSGKTPALDIVDGANNGITIDDNTSEISCVSQEKIGMAKGPTFKIVPYRQHNLTMLLQPFFSSKQTTASNLTLLMAAYPGHRDQAEKKSLLNDLELFFEAARENEEESAVTGFEKRPLSPIQFSPSSEEENDLESVHGNDTRVTPTANPDNKTARESPLPSAPPLDSSMAYSMDEEDEVVPLPPPYAPNASPAQPATTPPVASAPSVEMVVDFPGVVLPTSTTEKAPYTIPRGLEPHPCGIERSFDKDPPPKKPSAPLAAISEPLRATTIHNIEKPKSKTTSPSPTKAFVSGTKYAYSHLHSSAKKGMKMLDKMMTTDNSHDQPLLASKKSAPAEEKTISHNNGPRKQPDAAKMGTVVAVSSNASSKKTRTKEDRGPVNDATLKQLRKLEKQNHELLNRNKELESKCHNLSEENFALKQALKESRKAQWTKEDEEAWQKSKRNLAAPSLIQSPLNHHLSEVQRTFETNGRWYVLAYFPSYSY